jgi:hypothetical protein
MRTLAVLLIVPMLALAQAKPAKLFPPDEATHKKITDGIADFEKQTKDITEPDILIYLKAAQWIVKHDEWHTEKSAQQTLDVLAMGRERLKQYEKGKPFPWLEARGRPVIRGYRSTVDGSIQPYAVRYPDNFDPEKKYRVDVILHGRDDSLTEVKFLHAKEKAKPGAKLDFFEIEVYGRGNNAYRWAGEKDIFEAMWAANSAVVFDNKKIVLRGFSMGGAGTWHIGLRHPFTFAALGPGAGFTTTRGYIANFPKQPDYIEKCLRIYDAVGYAENVFNVPVFAYSGEKDKQKLAADLIEAKLKDFKEPHTFKHFVAPGLEHKQPAEWLAKLEVEYRKALEKPRLDVPERYRFVTYDCDYMAHHNMWIEPIAQFKLYDIAVIDARFLKGKGVVETLNVQTLTIRFPRPEGWTELVIDGQQIPQVKGEFPGLLEKVAGKWKASEPKDEYLSKSNSCQGPIDRAFKNEFYVVKPTAKPWHDGPAIFAEARYQEFAANWSRYFRGVLSTTKPKDPQAVYSRVLFGDPQSNPAIAKVLPKLPITWTKDELVVNGKKYDPKTHLPVLIYPDPDPNGKYLVINSGHTFRETDLKGTNALLYPRLGDWAVLKAKPTKDDPAGFEVVAAGLFDADWKFEKK